MSLFTRIYLTLILTLVLTTAGVVLVLDQVNRHRFSQFALDRIHMIGTLIEYNWETLPEDRVTDWLAILSRLTGTEWILSTANGPPVSDSQWWSERASVRLEPNDGSGIAIESEVTDWDELLIGAGYLMVNALSLEPAAEREAHLDRLVAQSGLRARPVSIGAEPLGFLQQRQLERGQAVLTTQSRPLSTSLRQAYIPMGQGNALKLGPVVQYAWLTPLGMGLLIAVILPVVGGCIYLVLVPLKRRMARMISAVDAIEQMPARISVPETPADELGSMGRHINRMAARLVDFARRNKELNQSVSHDLKTPLSQLKFALELLKPSDDQQYAVRKMRQSLTDMENLVDELLVYHSLADIASVRRETVTDLHQLIPAIRDGLEIPPGMHLEVNLDDQPLAVTGEERLLRRLLVNLIGNALKYGKQDVILSAGADTRGGVMVVIEDDGPGIPAAERKRVIEPFYQLDRTRGDASGGHGLGLAISQDIVDSLRGSLTFEDSTSVGCRVAVRLPGVSYKVPTKDEHHRHRRPI